MLSHKTCAMLCSAHGTRFIQKQKFCYVWCALFLISLLFRSLTGGSLGHPRRHDTTLTQFKSKTRLKRSSVFCCHTLSVCGRPGKVPSTECCRAPRKKKTSRSSNNRTNKLDCICHCARVCVCVYAHLSVFVCVSVCARGFAISISIYSSAKSRVRSFEP